MPLQYIAILEPERLQGSKELENNRAAAYRMLIIEAVIVFIISLLFFMLANANLALSVMLGGIAFIVPNLLFVIFSLRSSSSGSSGSTLAWFYVGEAIKIVLTIIIFTVSILIITTLNIGIMFVTYGVILLINLTGLALLMNQ
ncbi:MAG: ATP synthase subunit I [Pseudomonadota bacterium]